MVHYLHYLRWYYIYFQSSPLSHHALSPPSSPLPSLSLSRLYWAQSHRQERAISQYSLQYSRAAISCASISCQCHARVPLTPVHWFQCHARVPLISVHWFQCHAWLPLTPVHWFQCHARMPLIPVPRSGATDSSALIPVPRSGATLGCHWFQCHAQVPRTPVIPSVTIAIVLTSPRTSTVCVLLLSLY